MEDEQSDKNRDRDRDHVRIEHPGGDIQSFHRAEHGDRWRDHPVGVEQRRSEQAKKEEIFSAPCDVGDQGRQRQDAAFAAVIRPQDKDQIFDGDDEEERPNDERQNAQDVGISRWHRVRPVKTLSQGIERAGANVPVNDAETGDTEQSQATFAPAFQRSLRMRCRTDCASRNRNNG